MKAQAFTDPHRVSDGVGPGHLDHLRWVGAWG